MENLDIKALEAIEKSKPAQLGEVRTWGGKEYIKTPKGWRPKPKGFKEGEKKETTPKGNPVMKPEKATPKNVTDQFKVGDHVMYNGKEMILTRISKDGRFQNGIEMKFAKEGETTPTGSKTKVGNMMYATPVNMKPMTESELVDALGVKPGESIRSRLKKEVAITSKSNAATPQPVTCTSIRLFKGKSPSDKDTVIVYYRRDGIDDLPMRWGLLGPEARQKIQEQIPYLSKGVY